MTSPVLVDASAVLNESQFRPTTFSLAVRWRAARVNAKNCMGRRLRARDAESFAGCKG
jgi:hypothetical protein